MEPVVAIDGTMSVLEWILLILIVGLIIDLMLLSKSYYDIYGLKFL
jgi:hypothetical protein